MPTETVETVQEWMARNPLRIWRRTSEMNWREIAVSLGVSVTALQKWESGVMQPNEANIARIERLTNFTVTRSIWEQWHREAPTV
jgi:DNA-binding transcriptional regulator YiaG